MPRSRRQREVALTQTDKRSTRAHKTQLIQKIRDGVDQYDALYVLEYKNMRSSHFKNVRTHFKEDMISLGKHSLLQLALGRTIEDEYSDNLHFVSKHLVGGSVALLFTNQKHAAIAQYFNDFVRDDFARAGSSAAKDVYIRKEQLEAFPSSMTETFRKLGLPVKLNNGTIVFRDDQEAFQLVKEGETLSAEKCKLLTHFGVKLSEFKVSLACRWADGEYEPLK